MIFKYSISTCAGCVLPVLRLRKTSFGLPQVHVEVPHVLCQLPHLLLAGTFSHLFLELRSILASI